jgi:hypothetical protein
MKIKLLKRRPPWKTGTNTHFRTPGARFDLIMTYYARSMAHYARPAMPQLELYNRIAGWMAW